MKASLIVAAAAFIVVAAFQPVNAKISSISLPQIRSLQIRYPLTALR